MTAELPPFLHAGARVDVSVEKVVSGRDELGRGHLTATLPCVPCLKRKCHQEDQGPLSPPCLGAIPVERVLEEVPPVLDELREASDDQLPSLKKGRDVGAPHVGSQDLADGLVVDLLQAWVDPRIRLT